MDLYIVTGASRGLGRALVTQLAAQADARTVAMSRSGVDGVAAWRDIRVDLSSPDALATAALAVRDAVSAQRWSRAVLVNNAGIIDPIGIVGALDMAPIADAMVVNVAAPIALMNAFIAALDPATPASVINISSGSGRRPVPGTGVYCATKAALDMVSKVAVLEMEAKKRPVTITSLAPGIFETGMQVAARSKSAEEFPSVGTFLGFKEQNLLKSPEEVAARLIAAEKAGKMPAGLADLREL